MLCAIFTLLHHGHDVAFRESRCRVAGIQIAPMGWNRVNLLNAGSSPVPGIRGARESLGCSATRLTKTLVADFRPVESKVAG